MYKSIISPLYGHITCWTFCPPNTNDNSHHVLTFLQTNLQIVGYNKFEAYNVNSIKFTTLEYPKVWEQLKGLFETFRKYKFENCI